jgi:gamma-glutamyltranspeptidase
VTGPAAGVVASGHPVAAAAGLRILDAGGGATDAALAMAFTQWVVNAPLCGPGGDLVVLRVAAGVPTVFGGWSRVPGRVPPGEIPYAGPAAAVIPAALPAARAAWTAGCRLPWADLFAPALDAARGHEVTPWMESAFASVDRRGHAGAIGRVYDTAHVPTAGEVLTSRRLEHSLGLIADKGLRVLLPGGELGDAVIAASREARAGLTAEDLLLTAVPIVEPARTVDLGDLTISFPGSPSQASITAELLAAVDPDVVVESASFAEALAPLTESALTDRCVVGLPGTATSVAAVGDEAVIVVHSLAGVQFGTGWVVGETGIAIGNRAGTSLTRRPELPATHPNPGAVLPHTLSAAWLVCGDRSMLVATPGGDRQVQWLAQAAQRFRQGGSAEDVVSRPRWFVCPEGDRFGVPQGIGQPWYVWGEPGIEWRDRAEVAGYPVKAVNSVGGGLQAVLRAGSGPWTAASDPRAGGAAGRG